MEDNQETIAKVLELIEKIESEPPTHPSAIIVPLDLTGISTTGLEQSQDVHKSLTRQYIKQVGDVIINEDGSQSADWVRARAACMYACIPVFLNDDGSLPEKYRFQWVRMLSDLADRGIWDKGTLDPASYMEMHRHHSLAEAVKLGLLVEGASPIPTPPAYSPRRGWMWSFLFSSMVNCREGSDEAPPEEIEAVDRLLKYALFSYGLPPTVQEDMLADDKIEAAWASFPWA